MKLNDIKCKKAKPLDPPSKAPRKLADGKGLYLWVMPNGAKYWQFVYRIHGKQKTLALGVYPEMSLKIAREMKMDAPQLVSEGKDPSLEKKKKKNKAIDQQNKTNTFKLVALEWYEVNKSKWSEHYADGVLTRLETYIFPEI